MLLNVYLAAPFFTDEQISTVQTLEKMLHNIPAVELYSPRQDGVILMDLPPVQRAAACEHVFKTNVERILWCDCVLACIDGRDTGTVWEMGFAYANNKRIITYTSHNYGLNVMLQCCVAAHVHSLVDLTHIFNHGARDDVCKNYRAFHPETT